MLSRAQYRATKNMNKVILIGNVGRDPERKGEKVVAFSLATTENGYTKQDGTKVEDRTEWHNITIFDPKLASFAEKYVRKGSRLILEGKIHYSDYTDKEGVKRQGVEIIATAVSFDQVARKPESTQEGEHANTHEGEGEEGTKGGKRKKKPEATTQASTEADAPF